MKQVCVYVDEEVVEALVRYKVERGVTKVWVVNEALRVFLGLKNEDRAYLDLDDGLRAKLRAVCVAKAQTIGEVVREIVEGGLE